MNDSPPTPSSTVAELEERLRALTQLHELVSTLGRTLDCEACVEAFLDRLASTWRVAGAALFVASEAEAPAEFAVRRSVGIGVRAVSRIPAGLVARVADHAAPPVPLASGSARPAPDAWCVRDVLPQQDAATCHGLAVGLHSGRRAVGALVVFRDVDAPFSGDECALLGVLAARLAVTLDHALLDHAAQARERHMRALLDNALDITAIVHGDGTLRFASAAIEEILGYTPRELTERPALAVVAPEDRPLAARAWTALRRRAGRAGRLELRCLHRDGSVRVLRVAARNKLDDSAIAGIVLSGQDVTHERDARNALARSEEQLAHAQKLDALGRLAGGVAHDFNNLLTTISGYAELLRRHLPDGDRTQRHADEILRAASRGADLTRQLLAFSRAHAVAPQRVDLTQALHDLHGLLERLIGEDVALRVHTPARPVWVRCGAGQFEQVVMNLAVNARDAMPHGGTLTIELDVCERPAADDCALSPGLHAQLLVRDTGDGIPADIQARIFEPFFTTKERGKGTGLGLSTVYSILSRAHGDIAVDSLPGQGTTFRAHLPLDASTPQDRPGTLPGEDAAAAPASGRPTILLVEDEALVRDLVREILDAMEFDVLVSADGPSAVDVFRREFARIDLVLTDVVMPRMSGPEAARAMLACDPHARILFMSGYTDQAAFSPRDFGPRAEFLAKPFTTDELGHKVRDLLQRPRDARAA